MSLSLALGILVGDVGGFRLLTSAHAQGSSCSATLIGDSVNIGDGVVLSGIVVRDITVNGAFLAQGVIVGGVRLADATLVGTNGVIVGGDGGTGTNGVIVGGVPTPGEINVGGASVSSSGTAVGGTLTGDNISVANGVITGQNLLLSGAAINGGSIGGTVSSVTVTPGN